MSTRKSAKGNRQKSACDTPRQQQHEQQQQQQQQQQQKEGMQTKNETENKNWRQQATSAEKKTTDDASSPRSTQKKQQYRSPNKIYRAPPTPEPEILHVKERSFVLDSVAVNTISDEYAKTPPKLGQVRRTCILVYLAKLSQSPYTRT